MLEGTINAALLENEVKLMEREILSYMELLTNMRAEELGVPPMRSAPRRTSFPGGTPQRN